jgi:protein disulfide-isomerase A6
MYVHPYSLCFFLTSVQKIDQTRVLLLSKAKDIPLMWKVLANKYRDDFAFANHRDRKGKSSEALHYNAGTQKESKILVYPAGSAKPLLFEGTCSPSFSNPGDRGHSNISAGVLKYKAISKFFNSILDGTANLTAQNSQVPEDSHEPTTEEQEIERKQEAQRLALLHGGFSDIIDFEKAIKEHGTDFHGAHGYTSRPGDTTKMDDPDKGGEDTYERVEDPIHRAIRIQLEKEKREAKDALIDSLHEAVETDLVIPEQRTATGMAHPSATTNMKVPHRAPETCIPESVIDSVAPSCVSPVSEREALPTHEENTTSEPGHVKDEL